MEQNIGTKGFHADRIACGNRDNRDTGSNASPCFITSKGEGETVGMYKQLEANRTGYEYVPSGL